MSGKLNPTLSSHFCVFITNPALGFTSWRLSSHQLLPSYNTKQSTREAGLDSLTDKTVYFAKGDCLLIPTLARIQIVLLSQKIGFAVRCVKTFPHVWRGGYRCRSAASRIEQFLFPRQRGRLVSWLCCAGGGGVNKALLAPPALNLGAVHPRDAKSNLPNMRNSHFAQR